MKVDYDQIARTYAARYSQNDYSGVEETIARLALDCFSVLEVGCGTGHWLSRLHGLDRRVVGVDPSTKMLRRSPASLRGYCLVRGVAEALPFADRLFDLVLVVNALHHFDSLGAFVAEAARVVRPGGVLATIGLDPSTGTDRWYVYDFFPRALELDRQRYPSTAATRATLEGSGFEAIATEVAQHFPVSEPARPYLESGTLHRHTTSQLSLLTDEEFDAGLDRIWSAIKAGEVGGAPLLLYADLRLYLTRGRLRGARTTGAA